MPALGMPALGAGIGVIYLIGCVIGAKPLAGVIALAIMLGFSGAQYVIAWRSETVRGLLDRRDERITAIDLCATAVTALAMIAAVLVGFVVDIARGGTSGPRSALPRSPACPSAVIPAV
jgi:hypothetical protein